MALGDFLTFATLALAVLLRHAARSGGTSTA